MAFSGTFDGNGYPIDPDTNEGDTGWHICDGTNGTPDLRGKFILGASDSHVVGSTGGEENHTLTIDEMPVISGTIGSRNGDNGGIFERDATGVFSYQDPQKGVTYEAQGDGSPSWTTYRTAKLSFGGSQPHNNMPPYYALSYIMKV